MLYVNADDLGFDKDVTDQILTCYQLKRIHSASAMVFMKGSERASDLAIENQMPTGLHINFDQALTVRPIPKKLKNHHQAVSEYLKARKWNQIIYNPLLRNSFDYIFQAQWDEFYRLYDKEPERLDGHHHMHLCMNMLVSGKLPKGIRIRRNFTFYRGEKDPINRFYRYLVDHWLQTKFICTDYFFSMRPINYEKLKKIVFLSSTSDVELMVHPGVEEEYEFLLSSEWAGLIFKPNNIYS
jgi:chitin disaccharide deacetylase